MHLLVQGMPVAAILAGKTYHRFGQGTFIISPNMTMPLG